VEAKLDWCMYIQGGRWGVGCACGVCIGMGRDAGVVGASDRAGLLRLRAQAIR
jgi:hypothetical protein